MSSFQFKIKGYLNETGEYTEFFPAEPGTILQFILQHWFNETLPNNLDCVVIKNAANDLLILDHLKRDVFDYYLLPADQKRNYFHRKTDIQFMFFLLESFFSNRLDDLKANLREKSDDWQFVREQLPGKSFDYQITRQLIWQKLSWLGYQFGAILLLMVLGIVVHPIMLAAVAVLMALVVFTQMPLLKMYRQYYLDNKNLKLTVSRGSEQMTLQNGSWTRVIPKTDIRKLTRFVPPADDVRAHAEYYLEIEFLNGDVLNLTSLLINQADADGKFMHNLLPFEVVAAENGLLKRPTQMGQYFSAIGLK